ncbi:chitin synthase export chaperone [Apiospora phragmitis]|uniref:Chitin synthase export chaperone n=1 Tax=Apiospora phragmitis TaxID=2905665 RepID=A0ABR1UI65_9PEZI
MGGFGDFTTLCETAPLPLCASVGPIRAVSSGVGIEPDCYARNIELANTIIFEGASSFMHILSLAMTIIMILHIRGKFTAVGRKEILAFFYFYMLLSFFSLIVDAGVVPPGSDPYPYFVSIQAGLTSSLVTCLLINGFVGFQLYEDGTPLSVWLLRLCSIAAFAISFLVSLATFKSWAGLGPINTVGLFTVLYLLNAIQLVVYVVMQVMLVSRTCKTAGRSVTSPSASSSSSSASSTICNATSHYLDGLFFATICNLLAVMMVYKYWDSITKEDLEFSVGMRMNNWEVKDLLPEEDRRTTMYMDDPSPYAQSSAYDRGYSPSNGNRMSRY